MAHEVIGHEFREALRALGIEAARTQKVIIEVGCDSPPKIYVEMFGASEGVMAEVVKRAGEDATVVVVARDQVEGAQRA